VQAAAAEALGDLPTQEAANLAARWAADDVPRESRKAARRALLRLAQRGLTPQVVPVAEAPPAAKPPPERIRRALMSAVYGQGLRLLYLLVDLPLQGGHMVLALVSELEGLVRFQAHPSTARQFERAVGEERQQLKLPLVDIPPAYARRLLAEAVAASRRAGTGLPPQYATFGEAIDVPPDPAALEVRSPVYDELDAAALRYRPDLVEQSLELLERPEFAGWVPAPERIESFVREWQEIERSPIALPPYIVEQRRKAVRDRLIDWLLGPGGVTGFKRWLEDNALVLLRGGEGLVSRQALAAAVALDAADPAAARAHPLLRGLAEQALDSALAALERGDAPGREARPGEAPGSPRPWGPASRLILP
jgi:hypothetical protein